MFDDGNRNAFLKDASFLMALLATVAKMNGGEIEFTEADMMKVGKTDLLGMYYNEGRGTYSIKTMTQAEYAAQAGESVAAKSSDTSLPWDDDPDEWEN